MMQSLIERSNENRIYDLERLAEGAPVTGDFKGNVTARWVTLGPSGEGKVTYNNKEYSTKPIGFVSVPKGTEVEMSFASGIYYTKF